jgi:hypothetical protein
MSDNLWQMKKQDEIIGLLTDIRALLTDIRNEARMREIVEDNPSDSVPCGVCGVRYQRVFMRYGVLGEDAGWVCADCIEDILGQQP